MIWGSRARDVDAVTIYAVTLSPTGFSRVAGLLSASGEALRYAIALLIAHHETEQIEAAASVAVACAQRLTASVMRIERLTEADLAVGVLSAVSAHADCSGRGSWN